MKPPYEITPTILKLVSSISEKLGIVNANYLNRQTPQLRKQNRIKTIHASLQIEGNSMSEEQITALIENSRVIGPQKDIVEVLNAVKLYENIKKYKYKSGISFLKAHAVLMKGLMEHAGKYRSRGVGIVRGNKIEHIAPPYKNVPSLMNDLFDYLKNADELTLIKSCVFHYEMEFIHPFSDGNGRMGRFWQTLILMSEYPIFEFLSFESLINKTQKEYYNSLAKSDRLGKSTVFIEYMLDVMNKTLDDLLNYNNRILTDIDRLEYFVTLGIKEFGRKDYMNTFKDISSATASRDLKKGIELRLFNSIGSHNLTKYSIV